MLKKRIIPCLDIRDGRVVKGVNFDGIKDVSDPVELAGIYNAEGADELVFYDITASIENRGLFTDVLKRVAGSIFIPLTVGGGINTLDDFERVLSCGADKVSVNSGAIKNPGFIKEAAKKYGNQCVVLSMDVARENGEFIIFTAAGKKSTGINAVEWAKRGEANGAGELVINSIDTDGVKNGFDIEMLETIGNAVSIPIVASGGAGCTEDFFELFDKLPMVNAGLAASIFHYREVSIRDLKLYLDGKGIPVRLTGMTLNPTAP